MRCHRKLLGAASREALCPLSSLLTETVLMPGTPTFTSDCRGHPEDTSHVLGPLEKKKRWVQFSRNPGASVLALDNLPHHPHPHLLLLKRKLNSNLFKLCFLEKEMATHLSTLAWKIPWTEEPGGLQSMGSQRVRQDWATSLSFFSFWVFCHMQWNIVPTDRTTS